MPHFTREHMAVRKFAGQHYQHVSHGVYYSTAKFFWHIINPQMY